MNPPRATGRSSSCRPRCRKEEGTDGRSEETFETTADTLRQANPQAGPFIFLAMVVLSTLAQSTAKWWKSLSVLGYLPALLVLAAAVYSTILIVRIFSLYLIRKPLAGLLTAQDIFSLLLSYAVFILGILLLLSLSFLVIEHLGLGCLTYAPTGDPFTRETVDSTSTSHEYFYFAAVTFFTIGYGDICPLGLCKIMAVVTAFAGNIVTVVLMAIVVSLYLNRRTKPPDQASTIQSERSMEKS